MPLDDYTLATALVASSYIIRIVSATSSAVRTDNVSVVIYLEIVPCVQLFERNCDLEFIGWSSLLLPKSKYNVSIVRNFSVDACYLLLEHPAENTSKRIVLLPLRFIYTLFATAVVFTALILIAEHLIRVSYVMEPLFCVFISLVSVWMIL